MRRRKRKKKHISSQRGYHKPITTRKRLTRSLKRRPMVSMYREEIPYDRRFHRKDNRLPLDTYGREVILTLRDSKTVEYGASQTKAKLGFQTPRITPICRRRASRRKSLFALGKIGKGVKGPKYRRMTEWSKVRC